MQGHLKELVQVGILAGCVEELCVGLLGLETALWNQTMLVCKPRQDQARTSSMRMSWTVWYMGSEYDDGRVVKYGANKLSLHQAHEKVSINACTHLRTCCEARQAGKAQAARWACLGASVQPWMSAAAQRASTGQTGSVLVYLLKALQRAASWLVSMRRRGMWIKGSPA